MRPWGKGHGFYGLLFLLVALPHLDGNADTVKVVGAGASFPREVYQVWMGSYSELRRQHRDVSLIYSAKGSGVGLSRIRGELLPPVDYAGTDTILMGTDYEKHPDFQMFPTMAGSVVLAYNLPGIDSLVLTRQEIVGIFNGTYSWWNDTTFAENNPSLDLPEAKIKAIVRADTSGTTEIFTSALTAFSDEWKSQYGAFSRGLNADSTPAHWNSSAIRFFGRGLHDVTFLLSVYAYSISYISLRDAAADGLAYALIKNKYGNTVRPNTKSVTAAMESFADALTNRLTGSLTDSGARDAYPIIGYTYFVVRLKNNTDCEVAKELVRFITWFLESPGAIRMCSDMQFTPVSSSLVEKIHAVVINKMMCNGHLVKDMVQQDIQGEQELERSTLLDLPLKIAIPCLVCVFLVSVFVIIYLKFKARKAMDRTDWNIDIEDVLFYEPGTLSFSRSRMKTGNSSMSLGGSKNAFDGEMMAVSDIIHWPAKWNNHTVSVKIQEPIEGKVVHFRSKQELSSMITAFVHENIVRFFGLTSVGEERFIVIEYCGKGILQDILHDDKLNLNEGLKFSIAIDVINGLQFLHANDIVHGHLKTSCCMLDSRWTVKIGDWELRPIRNSIARAAGETIYPPSYPSYENENKQAIEHFSTAPEIVKSHFRYEPTKACDVYSFAICLQEIFTREEPYGEHADNIPPKEVMILVISNSLRPQPTDDIPLNVRQIMEIAWSDNINSRPTVCQMASMLKNANPGKKSVMDSMIETLEDYAIQLERTVEEKAAELALAKECATRTHPPLLPNWLATKLFNNELIKSQNLYTSAIACLSFCNVSDVCAQSGTDVAVDILNDLYSSIIQTTANKGLMLVPRLQSPIVISPSSDDLPLLASTENFAEILLGMFATAAAINDKHNSSHPERIKLKISLHVGSVTVSMLHALTQLVAFGEGVDTAIRLIDLSESDLLLISKDVYDVLYGSEKFILHSRGKHKFEDKTSVYSYWLTRRHAVTCLQMLEGDSSSVPNIASVDC